MALIAELMLRASLNRTESRASHYREDYPARNCTDWMKWIIVGKTGGKISLRTEPVPLDRYKFKPTTFTWIILKSLSSEPNCGDIERHALKILVKRGP